MDPMDVDATIISEADFLWKYKEDYPNSIKEDAKSAYKDYLKTNGKQASETRLLGGWSSNGEKSLNIVTGFVLYY